MYSASEIIVRNNDVCITHHDLHNDKILKYDMDDELNSTRYLACTSNYGHVFDEFDIISNLYPIVPDYFYNIVESYCVLNDHLKKFSNFAKGIAAFYEQNPLEIDEELGLYMEEHDRFGKKDVHIRTLNKKRSVFFLNEIRIPIKGEKGEKNYKLALTAFIAPRELRNEELDELEKYKEIKPSYYKGVKEGWSIIVTGESDDKMNTYIKAGRCSRKEMVQLIPQSFWEKFSSHTHIFPNGDLLRDYINKE